MGFFVELLHNFNIRAVVDLFGSTNLAKACVYSTPPRPYLCLCRNYLHASVLSKAVDTFIAREMGRAGPPASKFYVEGMKDVVAEHLPPLADDAVDSDVPSDSQSES